MRIFFQERRFDHQNGPEFAHEPSVLMRMLFVTYFLMRVDLAIFTSLRERVRFTSRE